MKITKVLITTIVVAYALQTYARVQSAAGIPMHVFLDGFASSSMDFEPTWCAHPNRLDLRSRRNPVIKALKNALDSTVVKIPYPYDTLTFTPNEPLIYKQFGARSMGREPGRRGENKEQEGELEHMEK